MRAPLSDEIPYFSEFVGKHIVSQGNTSAGRDHTGLDASTSVALISQRGRGEEGEKACMQMAWIEPVRLSLLGEVADGCVRAFV